MVYCSAACQCRHLILSQQAYARHNAGTERYSRLKARRASGHAGKAVTTPSPLYTRYRRFHRLPGKRAPSELAS